MKNRKETENLLTTQGYKKIKKEIKYRETKLRESLSNTLNDMRSQGDLSENDGYTMAVEQSEQNEEEINRLTALLKNAKVVKRRSKTKVDIGSMVTIDYNDSEEKHKLEDRIVEIRNVLFKARVTKKECRVLADVGSEVVVAHKETVIVFKLVSSVEVDPSKNKVSVKSKVGKKLQGLRVGKKVKLPNAKGKEIEYRVLYVC